MLIRLQINNVEAAGPDVTLVYRARDKGFEIGREGRDWTLPDPDKFISGRHCEVRFEAGSFWLHDVSRNGTFLNGSGERMTSPHRLCKGDRLRIGRYVIGVSIDQDSAADSSRLGPAWQPAAPESPAPPQTPPARHEQGLPFQNRPQAPSPDPAASVEGDAFLGRLAEAAGIPPQFLLQRDRAEVADEIGAILRITVEQLALLLKARAAAKVLAKNANRTMINAADNNPLKFIPGTDEMLEIMFTRRRAGYLDARRSIEDAFADLKTHEFATYSAMQTALARMLDDLSPEAVERKVPASSFGSRKARAWDLLTATWSAKERAHENGMLDVFLAYFSEAYAKAAAKPK